MRRENRKAQEVTIKPDGTEAEVLAASVVEISKAARRLIKGPLKMNAIVMLVHHAMPASTRVSQRQIREVFEAAERLQTLYTTIPRDKSND